MKSKQNSNYHFTFTNRSLSLCLHVLEISCLLFRVLLPLPYIIKCFSLKGKVPFFFKFPDLCCSTSRRAVLATSLGNDTSRGSRGNLKAARRQFSIDTKGKISELQGIDIFTQILRSKGKSHVRNNDTSRSNLKAARRQFCFWQF